jgi:2-keto-myo-inositol isomerase
MISCKLSRRQALLTASWLAGGAIAAPKLVTAAAVEKDSATPSAKPFVFSLNTATIRGQKLGIVKEIEIVAKAGFGGFEPWIDTIEEYVKGGGKLADLKNQIIDSGLTVEGAIGFPEWIVDDESRRAKGMERAKREMELVARIGGKRYAAPPAGATDLPKLDPLKAAERYRELLELGDQIGIVPQLELWGFSKNLSRLGECVCVAMETGHKKACVLADIFHMYKGGSDYRGFRLLGPDAVQVLHMNDYPGEPPRAQIDDSYRIYPGDGSAQVVEILRSLRTNGGQKVLSLELFNKKYWAADPLEVAKTGLVKLKSVAGSV